MYSLYLNCKKGMSSYRIVIHMLHSKEETYTQIHKYIFIINIIRHTSECVKFVIFCNFIISKNLLLIDKMLYFSYEL